MAAVTLSVISVTVQDDVQGRVSFDRSGDRSPAMSKQVDMTTTDRRLQPKANVHASDTSKAAVISKPPLNILDVVAATDMPKQSLSLSQRSAGSSGVPAAPRDDDFHSGGEREEDPHTVRSFSAKASSRAPHGADKSTTARKKVSHDRAPRTVADGAAKHVQPPLHPNGARGRSSTNDRVPPRRLRVSSGGHVHNGSIDVDSMDATIYSAASFRSSASDDEVVGDIDAFIGVDGFAEEHHVSDSDGGGGAGAGRGRSPASAGRQRFQEGGADMTDRPVLDVDAEDAGHVTLTMETRVEEQEIDRSSYKRVAGGGSGSAHGSRTASPSDGHQQQHHHGHHSPHQSRATAATGASSQSSHTSPVNKSSSSATASSTHSALEALRLAAEKADQLVRKMTQTHAAAAQAAASLSPSTRSGLGLGNSASAASVGSAASLRSRVDGSDSPSTAVAPTLLGEGAGVGGEEEEERESPERGFSNSVSNLQAGAALPAAAGAAAAGGGDGVSRDAGRRASLGVPAFPLQQRTLVPSMDVQRRLFEEARGQDSERLSGAVRQKRDAEASSSSSSSAAAAASKSAGAARSEPIRAPLIPQPQRAVKHVQTKRRRCVHKGWLYKRTEHSLITRWQPRYFRVVLDTKLVAVPIDVAEGRKPFTAPLRLASGGIFVDPITGDAIMGQVVMEEMVETAWLLYSLIEDVNAPPEMMIELSNTKSRQWTESAGAQSQQAAPSSDAAAVAGSSNPKSPRSLSSRLLTMGLTGLKGGSSKNLNSGGSNSRPNSPPTSPKAPADSSNALKSTFSSMSLLSAGSAGAGSPTSPGFEGRALKRVPSTGTSLTGAVLAPPPPPIFEFEIFHQTRRKYILKPMHTLEELKTAGSAIIGRKERPEYWIAVLNSAADSVNGLFREHFLRVPGGSSSGRSSGSPI